jgi:hypothetical protein
VTGTQIFICPAARTPLSGKTGAQKTNSAETADFVGILMSVIAGAKGGGADAAGGGLRAGGYGIRGDTQPGDAEADQIEQSGYIAESAAALSSLQFFIPQHSGAADNAAEQAQSDTGGTAVHSAPVGKANESGIDYSRRYTYLPQTNGLDNAISEIEAGQPVETGWQGSPDTVPDIDTAASAIGSDTAASDRREVSEGGEAGQTDKTDEQDLPDDTNVPEPLYIAQSFLAAAGPGNLRAAADADGTNALSGQKRAVELSSVRQVNGHREAVSGFGGREVGAVEFMAEKSGAPAVSGGDAGESYLSGITDSYYFDARPVTAKKPGGKPDKQFTVPAPGDMMKTEPAHIATRFEVRRIEYAEIGTGETEAVRQGAEHDPEIYTQLSGAIRTAAAKDDVSIFKIKLKPEGLGEVTVRLSRSRDRIDVELSAELASTKKLIEGDLETLRASLNTGDDAKAYRFASVTVESQPYGTSAGSSDNQHGRGGYNADNGKREAGYRAGHTAEEKTIGTVYKRFGNRLIDCIA